MTGKLAAFFAVPILALATPAAPAAAQSEPYDASRILDSFDIIDLYAVANEIGASLEPEDDDSVLITFANGLKASVYFTACNSGRCLGTRLQAGFGKPGNKSIAQTEELVEEFNRTKAAVKVFNRGDGSSMAQEYIIADGGITMGNYRAQVNLFSLMINRFRQTIYSDD